MFCANERLEREREGVTIVCDSKVVDSRAMIKKNKQTKIVNCFFTHEALKSLYELV